MMTIGSPSATPLLLYNLYAKLTALRLADACSERVHVGIDHLHNVFAPVKGPEDTIGARRRWT